MAQYVIQYGRLKLHTGDSEWLRYLELEPRPLKAPKASSSDR